MHVCECIEQMCVFVCMCLCVYVGVHMWVCVGVQMYVCMSALCVCVCVRVCVLGGDGGGRQITQRSGLPGRFLLKVL